MLIDVPLPQNDFIDGTPPNRSDLNSRVSTDSRKFSGGRQKVKLLHEAGEEEEVFFLGQSLPETESFADQERDQPLVRQVRVRLGIVEPVWIKLIRISPILRIVMDVENACQD